MARQEVKIPHERVAVLIGVNGAVKKRIEEKMRAQIFIDSQEGDVMIEGENSLQVFECVSIIKAIGRGFNPSVVELLFNEDNMFDLINIQDYIGRSKKDMMRMKGRVIGREGKAREMVEDATETHIVVYGKTIGFIGEIENVAVARHAMEMLLEGSPHGNVFNWLENKKRELIKKRFESGKGF